jgi:hypothetical protein
MQQYTHELRISQTSLGVTTSTTRAVFLLSCQGLQRDAQELGIHEATRKSLADPTLLCFYNRQVDRRARLDCT